MKIRDEQTKKLFIKYLKDHPEFRFWQAVRNFFGWPFIYRGTELISGNGLEDTFYVEQDEELIKK